MSFLAATALTAAALLTGPLATQTAQEITARIILTDDGLVWLRSGDTIKRIDLDGLRVPASVPTVGGTLADIAVTPDGAALFRLMEPPGKITTLVAHATASGAELGRWEIRTRGRSLAMSPDGTALAIVGLRPGARKKPAAHDWTLTLLDIVTGEIAEPHTLGQVPHGISIVGNAAGNPTLYLATDDRILTYTLSPLKASRFYNSPGMNRAVAATGRSAVLTVLRDTSLAVIDPSKWSRAGGRIQLSDDDATSSVELDSPGIALTLSADGSAAFVLHEDHRTLSIVDTVAASVVDTRTLDGMRDLMAGPTPDGRIVLASSDPGGSLTTISTPPATASAAPRPSIEEPVPEPPPAPVPPPALPEAESAIPEPMETQEPPPVKDDEDEPESGPVLLPPVVDRQPVPPPVLEPDPEPEEEPEPEPTPPEEEAEPEPPPPAPTEEPRKDPAEGLSGRLSGDFEGAEEVLLYGPDNILRLAARAAVAADGTFRFDTPPPGRYRVIVSAGPNGQIYTNPRFRTIQVEEGGTINESLDFEILGQI